MGFLGNLIERRSHPSNPSDWLLRMSGGDESAAGMTVNEQTALTMTAVWACIRILSENPAALPLQLFKRTENGKEKADDKPLYDVVHAKPNSEMASMNYRETSMAHMVGYGDWYSNIVRNNAGDVIELWPLRPDKMEVKRVGGELRYRYTLPSGKEIVLPRREVLHIPGLSFDGVHGYTPISKARDAIGLGLATQEHGARFFGNGARPGIILEHPNRLDDKAVSRLKESWSKTYGGLTNSHRMAVLEEGMTLKQFGIPNNDAQFLETRKFQVVEIARFFNVPPHMIQDLERATFSNIEESSLNFVKFCLAPWLVRVEQNLNLQLLTDKQRKRYFFEHNVDGLLRGDFKSRYEGYSVGRSGGWLSVNDILRKENMNAIEDGDTYLVPMNMVPADRLDEVVDKQIESDKEPGGVGDTPKSLRSGAERKYVKPPEGRDRIRAAFIPLFADAATRIVNMESNAVAKATKKHLRSQVTFEKWLDDFYGGDFPEKIRNIMGPVFRAYASQIQTEAFSEISETPEITPELNALVDDYIDGYVNRHTSSSVNQINALIRDNKEDAQAEIETRVSEWKETRAEKISTRETERESNAVAQAVFWGAGLQTFWRIRGPKTCPYCKELDGRSIKSGGAFLEAGTEFEPAAAKDGPMIIRGLKKHPPLHKGCDCFISSK